MLNKSKVAVIGGSGKSGKYLIHQLLERKIGIKLLLRRPENFRSDLDVEIVKGDARNFDSILNLLSGCDHLISLLGQPLGETPIQQDATRNIIDAMHQLGMSRYISVSGLNVDAPSDRKREKTKAATEWMKANFPSITEDRQLAFQLLDSSDLDWTLVRVPRIQETSENGDIRVDLFDCPGESIRAIDLANFLIDQIEDKRYLRRAPFIASLQ